MNKSDNIDELRQASDQAEEEYQRTLQARQAAVAASQAAARAVGERSPAREQKLIRQVGVEKIDIQKLCGKLSRNCVESGCCIGQP